MKKTLWFICIILFIATAVITFSPLVIAYKETKPLLWGMPRTLWLGILSSLIFIFITLLGANVMETTDKKKKQ